MKKLAVLIIAAFFTSHAFAADISTIMPALKMAKQAVDSTLAEIDTDIKAAAKALSAKDLKGDAARKILNNLLKHRSYVVDCSIIDANGVKITVEPLEYRHYENVERNNLPSVALLLKTKKPVMSDVYRSAEGINAINIGYPIFSDKGEFLGAVRMLIGYKVFLKPLVENKPCKIWVMQKNGFIVYDADTDQVGKNIFSDDMFKPFEDLIVFSKTVALSKNGAGSYSFYADGLKDKTLVEKVAAWDTSELYGTEWRVVAIEIRKTLEQSAVSK